MKKVHQNNAVECQQNAEKKAGRLNKREWADAHEFVTKIIHQEKLRHSEAVFMSRDIYQPRPAKTI